jgi:glycine dehydrogenase subunit 1
MVSRGGESVAVVTMSYIANTEAERQGMLAAIGVGSIEDLFDDVPARVKIDGLNIPPPLAEPELLRLLRDLSERNADLVHYPCFLGAGAYRHFIPSVVGYVTGRSEFSTSYTPYQPEVSQGNLQATYEYQSLICELTGMEVANASMYDGATAVAEAAIMAINLTNRRKVVLAPALQPEYPAVVRSYLAGQGVEILEVPLVRDDGRTEPRLTAAAAAALFDAETACLVVQQPNALGIVEDLRGLADVAHAAGALLVVDVDPIALGLLEAPGALGADIVVGEGQPLGLPTSFGGPYLGLFGCREAYIRQMPGRIVGATVDGLGNRGYVLTFQAREQHIRREKATSNICSNEALCALTAAVYLSWMGPVGLREVAETCLQRAHYAARRLADVGYPLAFPEAPFFKEFAVRCPIPPVEVNRQLLERGIVGGFPLGRLDRALEDCLLFCVTEMNPREEIDRLVEALAAIVGAAPSPSPSPKPSPEEARA